MFLSRRADSANSSEPIPLPVPVNPSGDFIGNDGKWSTFFINLGDDGTGRGQNVQALISTSSPATIVVQQSENCDEDCAKGRGIETFNAHQPLGYESKSSQAWKQTGLWGIPVPHWWTDEQQNGTWGTDNVGLGESSEKSPVLASQILVQDSSEQSWLSSFGLAIGPVSPGQGAKAKNPFLADFLSNKNIPSASYGYTAGASYRNNGNGTPGNLVLGGFDQSRFSDRGVSISMPSEANNTLAVGVPAIMYIPDPDVEVNTISFTSEGPIFSASIDSTTPYLWLPDAVCDQFAKQFQLDYDEEKNMYTLDQSALNSNRQQNGTISIKITDGPKDSTDKFANIDLPYSAFDLEASSPIFDNATRYFPIRKSLNGDFVLGRTFLQEAYIVVDYERANFTVAPAVFTNPMPQQRIVSIYKPGQGPPQDTPAPADDGGLAPGAIAGIVVGIVVVFLLAGLGAFFFWKKRRAQKQKAERDADKSSSYDTMIAGSEVKHRRVSELDSEPPGSPKPSMAGGYYDNDRKDIVPFPPINEMESPPAELYSPPPASSAEQSERGDYFIAGQKVRRRGATRESSANNTPGTPGAGPIAELPGDDGRFQVGGMHFDRVPSPKLHSRSASDTSLSTNIAEVLANPETGAEPKEDSKPGEKAEGKNEAEATVERRPSHARGASDTTIQSDSTAVSQPSPEELEHWRQDDEPRRPLSE